MGETLTDLRDRYEAFLRNERFDLTTTVTNAIDDWHETSGGSRSHAGSGCPRVELSLSTLRSYDTGLSQRLRLDPLRHLRALEAACHEVGAEVRPGYDKEGTQIRVALTGPVGASPSSPRQLTSASLRQLVCVEGVATKVSTIKPKVVQSVHYCPTTTQHSSREYIDATDPHLGLNAVDTTGREIPDRVIHITPSVYPTKDKEGHALETEYGLSTFKDHQTIVLQEMPEKAPMGQLPRSVELVLDHDLVDRIKPGDRVRVVGTYRALAVSSNGQQSSSGVFRTVVLVNHVQTIGVSTSRLHFHENDVPNIKELAAQPNILDVLGRSVAPSIHGHDIIKKALVLQLLAGVEKNLENGTHLRGDINILMVGDPSTAKSQLLRSAMTIAPLAVSTTGKGSSGVGLTAAVTSDPDTRERRLEAGAMVLADRGLVCVDEFDKMGENDRVAIHEAMEQQTVTIAKAGIHASLNARCAVLAAANPVYGQYDRRRKIQENIGLPDSLLSRFDLLFVVLDQMDPETDRLIAAHVIGGHRYRDDDGEDDESDDDQEHSPPQSIWQRRRRNAATNEDALTHDFLRKYLHYAKSRVSPVLTEAAREFIAQKYAEMRSRQDDRTLPITARSLETVIRLATAHAKARLNATVEHEDCVVAMDLLSFALYHEQESSPPNLKRDLPAVVSDESDAELTPSPPQRARLESAAAKSDVLSTRIWQFLSEHDGAVDVETLTASLALPNAKNDLETLDALQTTLVEMETQGRVHLTEGVIYALN
jgi:DNA replication licensing factor MCM3